MANWDSLSMREKADIMKVAISNGITNLGDIKAKYNEVMGDYSPSAPVEQYDDEEDNVLKNGGRIYIKPSHRGKFTALKKRTGHSASWFKAHGTPAQRKMATFALNAKHWKHADGGPLVDAANAHIYDGTTEDSQQMNDDYIFTGRPSQYDFQVTAEAPTVYWDGFNWIGFNDLGQRVTKGSNFNPSGARVIESPQEFENARLAQARKTDINGTHRFAEDIRNFTTDLVLMPAGDVIAEPIGILGGKALNAAAKTKAGKAVVKGIENIASKFTKGKTATPAEQWAVNTPQITAENAASITNAQWDAAYNKALNVGNKEEMQRLVDLHFMAKAPDTKITNLDGTPVHIYHGTNSDWVKYDPTKFGSATDDGYYGVGLYGTENKRLAQGYGKNVLDLYVNAKHPFTAGTQDINNIPYTVEEATNRRKVAYHFNRPGRNYNYPNLEKIYKDLVEELDASDAVVYGTPDQRFNEVVIPKGTQIKLSDAITYDNKGNVIPLSKRHNFKKNDIRYGLLAPIMSLPALSYFNNTEQ